MNEKQKELLRKLEGVLFELSEECIQDEAFNQKLASLNLFTKSLDEMAVEIRVERIK